LVAVLLSSACGFLFPVVPAPFVSGLRTHSAPAQRDTQQLLLRMCILTIALPPWIMGDKIQVIVQRRTQPVQPPLRPKSRALKSGLRGHFWTPYTRTKKFKTSKSLSLCDPCPSALTGLARYRNLPIVCPAWIFGLCQVQRQETEKQALYLGKTLQGPEAQIKILARWRKPALTVRPQTILPLLRCLERAIHVREFQTAKSFLGSCRCSMATRTLPGINVHVDTCATASGRASSESISRNIQYPIERMSLNTSESSHL
jgi:hypothetical protein